MSIWTTVSSISLRNLHFESFDEFSVLALIALDRVIVIMLLYKFLCFISGWKASQVYKYRKTQAKMPVL